MTDVKLEFLEALHPCRRRTDLDSGHDQRFSTRTLATTRDHSSFTRIDPKEGTFVDKDKIAVPSAAVFKHGSAQPRHAAEHDIRCQKWWLSELKFKGARVHHSKLLITLITFRTLRPDTVTMASPDVKMPSVQQTPSLLHGDKNISLNQNKGVEDAAILEAFQQYIPDTPEEKRLVRKIDFMLLPILWFMYILAHLDRSNIANANAAGMSEDLGLSDNRKSFSTKKSYSDSKVDIEARQNMPCLFRSFS